MPIATDFEYHKPKDLPEATGLLSRYQGRAQLLAGGTDLIVWLKEGMKSPEAVIDVKGIPELWHLDVKDGSLAIGARVTFTELIESDLVKEQLPRALGSLAHGGVLRGAQPRHARGQPLLRGPLPGRRPGPPGARGLRAHARPGRGARDPDGGVVHGPEEARLCLPTSS